jgi:hypothetical protein
MMMKHDIATLEGPRLDLAVATVLGLSAILECWLVVPPKPGACWLLNSDGRPNFTAGPYAPSTNSMVGGMLMEQHGITVIKQDAESGGLWNATLETFSHYIDEQLPMSWGYGGCDGMRGQTQLVAAMRALVRHLNGSDQIELP